MSMTFTSEQVEQRVLQALEDFDVDLDARRLDASMEEVDLDSLDTLELRQIITDEFGVVIRDEEMPSLRTVQDIIDAVLTPRDQ